MLKYFYYLLIIQLVLLLCITTMGDPLMLNQVQHHTANSKSSLKTRDSTLTSLSDQREKSDLRFFDAVVEPSPKPPANAQSPKRMSVEIEPKSSVSEPKETDKSYNEIKTLLAKVLERIEMIEKRADGGLPQEKANDGSDPQTQFDNRVIRGGVNPTCVPTSKNKKLKKEDNDEASKGHVQAATQSHAEVHQKPAESQAAQTDTQNNRNKKGARWGHWTDWSSCSVSCGKGRQIRWRHCAENCEEAETEMEEKTCQLPACAPKKIFGVLKV